MNEDLFKTLMKLRIAMLSAASAATAYDATQYEARKEHSLLAGHCAAVAYVIQHKLGGEIMAGRVGAERHYWNRLPDGIEIDLTRDQFPEHYGDGINPIINGRVAPERKTNNPRFVRFFQLIEKELHG